MRDDGSAVDATFELTPVPWFEIVYHHKAGGRDSPRSVNADYHEGLELLLVRLASVRAKIIGISVDSSIAHGLDADDRELDLQFPIDLDPTVDCRALRLEITRAQKSVARRDNAKPGGGNDQKRILITVGLYSRAVDYDSLRDLLVGGTQLARLDSSRPESEVPKSPSARRGEPSVGQVQRPEAIRRFWSGLLDAAAPETPLHARVSTTSDSWLGAGSGVSDAHYTYLVRQHQAGSYLYLEGSSADANRAIFDALRLQREAIERHFGEHLTWDAKSGRKKCSIGVLFDGGGYGDPEDSWPDVYRRMVDAMTRLEAALAPYLRIAAEAVNSSGR